MDAALRPRLRGISHLWAFPVVVVAGAVLVALASGAREHVAAAVYAASLAGLFGASALYHRGPSSRRVRAVLRRIDHSMIFVLIAGSITPFALLGLPLAAGIVMLALAWAAAVGGIVLSVVWIDAPKPLAVGLYVAFPVLGAVSLPAIFSHVGLLPVLLVGAGGVLYVTGAVVFAVARPDPRPAVFGYHEIFHLFVIAAALAHFAAVAVVIGGAPGRW